MKRTRKRFFLQWHITHKCNLRCIHCYQEEYNGHMEREDLFECLDKFCSFIKKTGYEPRINLTGGEPLSHPDFFDLCSEIRKRKINFSVLTNGTLIDEETAKRLKKLGPVFVQVSLDGIKKSHDLVRGEGNFDKALAGIDNLKKQGIKVLVSFTAQKNNIADFSGLARVCKEHKVDKLWWDRVVTSTKEEHEKLALTTKQFRSFVKKTARLKKIYDFLGHRFISNGRGLQFLGSKNDCYVCNAGKGLAVILADGSVMPCRRLPFVIGNIKNAQLYDIMSKSTVVKQLRSTSVPDGCIGCEDYHRCGGGSKCVTFAQTGKLDVRDVNCFKKR